MKLKRTKRLRNAQLIRTDKILPNPNQPRKNFSSDGLTKLAESISRYGMLEPVTVRRRGEYFELVTGERRLRAAKILDLELCPCIVLEITSRTSAEIALIENVIREDLNVFEEAQAIDTLIRSFNYTQEEIAARLGQSQSTVANKLRILRLSPDERLLITENHLSERHARALLKIQDFKLRLFALNFIINKEYNVRQSEAFIEALVDNPDEFIISLRPKPLQSLVPPKPVRKLVIKDVRLFVNSVDKAIYSIREAGVTVEAQKQEEEGYISYNIRIPKYEKQA